MKIRRSVLLCALAAILIFFSRSASAEESPGGSILTSLTSTTISGYVDTSANWQFGSEPPRRRTRWLGMFFPLVETTVDIRKTKRTPSAVKLPALRQRGHLQSDTMKSLDDHDKRHFEAAQGWLILGNHLEANAPSDPSEHHPCPFGSRRSRTAVVAGCLTRLPGESRAGR